MSTISGTMIEAAQSAAGYNSTSGTGSKKTTAEKSKTEESKKGIAVSQKESETEKKVSVSGRTIGTPKLTEKAAKYYEELKKKYGNMDFILVSSDQKEFAKATAGSYANPNRMVVLIDEEKIERMATDEKYRKQYEAIIANGANQLNQLKTKLTSMGKNVKSYGMKVNDNGAASFFATVDKGFREQRKKAQKKLAEKKAAKKAEDKKAQKKAEKEKLEQKREDKKASDAKEKDEITFTADSIDELIKKIEDMDYIYRSDNILSEKEKDIGQKFDLAV